jgi:UDP-N-acetyl-D-mannosaminuronic acid transferase (WecB/TagA/CpsF family)
VGDLFDHCSGRIAQTPGWMRRCGLGWAHQLAKAPRRTMRRYLVGKPMFLGRITLGWLRQRNRPRPASHKTQ